MSMLIGLMGWDLFNGKAHTNITHAIAKAVKITVGPCSCIATLRHG
jgi:hypothetical protein